MSLMDCGYILHSVSTSQAIFVFNIMETTNSWATANGKMYSVVFDFSLNVTLLTHVNYFECR